ncbi:MAG TPA: aminoacyl-tRNA hydrolase [Chloroflexi bacterium]|nr:aminoacyl-tRNA hydrolase [Chloroflexota bacterium]
MPVSFPLFGRSASAGPIEWLLAGLGNPGQKYSKTRHNVGFHILDKLAQSEGLTFDERRGKAIIARGNIEGVSVALVKPQTWMNLSGQAIAPIARFYKIPPERILIIYDDLDLPLAQLRIRQKGGAGGHKGMTSITQQLGSKDFPRIRIGIDRPPGQMPVEAYVLQKFTPSQWAKIEVTYQKTLDAIRDLVTHSVEYAMNNYNKQ